MIDYGKMAVANSVLAEIEKQAGALSLYLEAYSNGREQGYSVWSTDNNRRVAFSEYRNADFIVVYPGVYSDFAMQGNVPNKPAYQWQQGFNAGDYKGAAKWIVEYLGGQIDLS